MKPPPSSPFTRMSLVPDYWQRCPLCGGATPPCQTRHRRRALVIAGTIAASLALLCWAIVH